MSCFSPEMTWPLESRCSLINWTETYLPSAGTRCRRPDHGSKRGAAAGRRASGRNASRCRSEPCRRHRSLLASARRTSSIRTPALAGPRDSPGTRRDRRRAAPGSMERSGWVQARPRGKDPPDGPGRSPTLQTHTDLS